MSTIVSIGTAVPAFGIPQIAICDFMERLYDGTEEETRRLRLLYERSGISKRYSVIPDYDLTLSERYLYPHNELLEPFPSLEQRMSVYHQHAATLAEEAIQDCMKSVKGLEITDLITVSCTGMSAPGLDLELMERLHLPKNVQRTSINFMGCYAAVHALKMADAICKSKSQACVLIVCVELCTLHFQKAKNYDNLTANAIFADGAAACVVVSDTLASGISIPKMSLTGFYSEVHVSGKKDMAWELSSTGFLMTLSAYIPQLVEGNIEELVHNTLATIGMTLSQIDYWAIHPGGRKILEATQHKLGITKADLKHSYDVLNNYGNMSSATILFVLKELLQDSEKHGNIFGAAFGPGLTLETFIVNKYV
ncbi:MAG: type III polyketide synthase [Bacteroidota bacterium]